MSRTVPLNPHYIRHLESQLSTISKFDHKLSNLMELYNHKFNDVTQLIKLQYEYNNNIKHEYTQQLTALQSNIESLHDTIHNNTISSDHTIQQLTTQIQQLDRELTTIKQSNTQPPESQVPPDTSTTDRFDQIEKLLLSTDERTILLQSTISKIASDVLARFDSYQNITSQQIHNIKANLNEHTQSLNTLNTYNDRLAVLEQSTKYNKHNKMNDLVLSRLEEQIDVCNQSVEHTKHNTTLLIQQLIDKLHRSIPIPLNRQHTIDSHQHKCDEFCHELIQQQQKLNGLINTKLKLMDERIDELYHRINDQHIKYNTVQYNNKLIQNGVAADYNSDTQEHKSIQSPSKHQHNTTTTNPNHHVQPYIMYPAKQSIDHLERLVRTVDSLTSPHTVQKTNKHQLSPHSLRCSGS